MATFPSGLIPSARTYTPGEFPHTPHQVLAGTETRVRHSSTVLGVRLRLFFPAITTTELLAVKAHYNGQKGGFLAFDIPADLLSGMTTPADFTPTGHRWVYVGSPQVTDISIDGTTPTNRHDLTIELETVPPENSIVAGARFTVTATLTGGSPYRGALFEVLTSFTPGRASIPLALGVTVTFAPGAAG